MRKLGNEPTLPNRRPLVGRQRRGKPPRARMQRKESASRQETLPSGAVMLPTSARPRHAASPRIARRLPPAARQLKSASQPHVAVQRKGANPRHAAAPHKDASQLHDAARPRGETPPHDATRPNGADRPHAATQPNGVGLPLGARRFKDGALHQGDAPPQDAGLLNVAPPRDAGQRRDAELAPGGSAAADDLESDADDNI